MVTSSNGPRHRSRNILKKPAREKGLPPLGRFMQKYAVGDKVVIKIEPSVSDGMPDIRFTGKCGEVVEKRGKAYMISFKDGNMPRLALCSPVHLRRFK